MTLSKEIVRERPAERRFRLIAPLLVVVGLALLAMVPGVLFHVSNGDHEAAQTSTIERPLPRESR